MRRGGSILVLLGLVLGIITAGGTFLVLSQNQAQPAPVQTRPVVVALQNISSRTEVSADTLGVQDWPANTVPPNSFERMDDVTGRLSLVPIYQGQIILQPMLIDKKDIKEVRSNPSFLIPKGKIAVPFPISALSGVAYAIQDGDYVDILLTLSPPQVVSQTKSVTTSVGNSSEDQPMTQLMLQDVLILHVGSWSTEGTQDKNAQGPNIVTFALTWQDAIALKSAREQGTIELVLRGAGDHSTQTTEPAGLEYLNKRFKFNLQPVAK